MEVALDAGHASEITEVTPDKVLTIKAFSAFPDLSEVAVVVENNHLSLRHCRKVSLDVLVGPVSLVSIEKPTHLQPDSLRVHCRHTLVDTL